MRLTRVLLTTATPANTDSKKETTTLTVFKEEEQSVQSNQSVARNKSGLTALAELSDEQGARCRKANTQTGGTIVVVNSGAGWRGQQAGKQAGRQQINNSSPVISITIVQVEREEELQH